MFGKMRRAAMLAALAGAALAGGAATDAQAGLLGATVSGSWDLFAVGQPFSDLEINPNPFVVGAGVDAQLHYKFLTLPDRAIDFGDTTFTFTNYPTASSFTNVPFNGLVFTSDAFADIGAISLGSGQTMANFALGDVTLVGNQLRLNFRNIAFGANEVVALDFTFGAIPEPASWALLIMGFGLSGAVLRGRRCARGPAAAR